MLASQTGRPLLPTFSTVADAVRAHAALRPEAIAFATEAKSLTYGQLEERSGRLASGLKSVNTGCNERVAFLGKNCIEFFEILLACMNIGAVAVPVNWRLAPREIAGIIDDMDCRTLFVTREFANHLKAPDAPPIEKMIVIADGTGGGDYETWLAAFPPLAESYAALPSDIAIQLYSSGTTGKPKGAMLSHRAYHFAMGLENSDWPTWLHWSSDDVALVSTPLFHVSGVGWGIRSLFFGATTVLVDKFDAEQIILLVGKFAVTRIPLVPSALRALLDHPRIAEADFSSIRHLQYGASPIEQDLLAEAMSMLGCDLVQTYGLTETAFGVVALDPDDHLPSAGNRYRATGRPLPGVQIRIVDPDGSDLTCNAIGEILIKSPSLMSGYWKQPEATAKAIDAQGWLRTGDAGYLDEDGYLFVSGRLKEIIVTGGENVFPGEVENALFGHPSVSEVAVIGMPSRQWGEEVTAVIVPAHGCKVDGAELIAYARRRIAGYKLPKSFATVEQMPRNAAGKILRQELKKVVAASRSA